jgi:PAS domain S-box-containing protein
MRFYQRISFRIWLYFSLAISLVFFSTAWYYSHAQRNLILDSHQKQLKEFCRTISLGVEISLSLQDFNKLDNALDYFKQNEGEYDFLLLTQKISATEESLFSFQSLQKNFNPTNLDSSEYLIRYHNYNSEIMSGRIISGISRQRIDQQVSRLNRPVYLTVLFIFGFSFILFYFLARNISLPISRVIENAHLLGQNKFDEFSIADSQGSDEIGLMEQALVSLRNSLIHQQETNRSLINNLEVEVFKRTASLNEALEKLTEAQETALLASFTWYPETGKWTSSENLKAILGLEKDAIIDYNVFYDKVDEKSKNIFIKIFTLARDRSVSESLPLHQEDSGNKWLNITCRYINANSKEYMGYFSGTIQDVTERKNAEQELERLSLLATNTTNLVVFTDTWKRITWVNNSLIKLTGYSREELYGKTPRIFQSKNSDINTIQKINDALKEKRTIKAEVLNVGKLGNEYWLELYIQPIFNRNNEHMGFMAIEIDISERKATEEKLREYVDDIERKQEEINSINENLEELVKKKTNDLEKSMLQLQNSQEELIRKEKMATLGMLVAGIAHEVNTPLGAIKASAENLNFLLGEGILKMIFSLHHHEISISTKLLDVGRRRTKLSTQQERVASKKLQEKFDNCFTSGSLPFWVSRSLAQLGIETSEQIPEEFFSLPPDRIEALLNITSTLSGIDLSVATIENASIRASKIIRALNVYSHSEESAPYLPFDLFDSINGVADLLSSKFKQGAVFTNNIKPGTMLTGQEDELSQVWTNLVNNALQASNNKCRITVRANQVSEDKISIEIENDGPPIPPEIQTRIFEEFFTTKKRGEGTGLGLSIVSRIVSRHHGTVSCRSGEGSTVFTVVLPNLIKKFGIEENKNQA